MRLIHPAVQGRKALAWLISMAALFAFGSPIPAEAGKSHLLQKAGRHVVLTTIFVSGADPCGGVSWQGRGLAEVAPDGTVSAQEFVVPDGQVLVVTDLDWSIQEAPTDFVATRLLYFRVYLEGSGPAARVFGTGEITGSDLAVAGVAEGSASMTTGFRVGPDVPICPRAGSYDTSTGAIHTVSSLTLRGYLIKSK